MKQLPNAEQADEKSLLESANENTENAKKQPKHYLSNAKHYMNDKIADFGEYICSVLATTLYQPVRLIRALSLFLWKHTGGFRAAIFSIISYVFYFLISPFIKIKRSISRTISQIKRAKGNGDKRTVLKLYLVFLRNAIFGKRGIAVTVFNYAAPLISLSFLLSIVSYATNVNYAVKLTVNGQYIGYVENEQVFDDAERIMQERIAYLDSAETIVVTPEFSLEKAGYQELMSKYQVAEAMLKNSDVNITYAYGMYIGGTFYGALLDTAPVEAALEKLLDQYRTGNKDEDVAFSQNITYVGGLYLEESIVDTDKLIAKLSSTKSAASYYTIVENDSPYAICDKLGIPLSELERLNPDVLDEDYVMRVGDQLLRESEVPFLAVSVSRVEEYDVSVPYETEYTTDDEHYEGVQTIIQDGENGENHVTAKVFYTNGIETKRVILSTVKTTSPVSKIVSEGTLAPQSSHYSDESVAVDKKYIWPVAGGYFLEWGWWDGGYYGHYGIDIGGAYGADVYAGASGTVVAVGWGYNAGWGNYVKIQHPDGYYTLYAHNSDIYVYVGQQVSQGQCIAAIGATGAATCNHCHFEVWEGSYRVNPRYYLNGV